MSLARYFIGLMLCVWLSAGMQAVWAQAVAAVPTIAASNDAAAAKVRAPDPVVVFDANKQPMAIDALVMHWIDPTGAASIDQAHRQALNGGFVLGNRMDPIKLTDKEALWIRIQIQRDLSPERQYLVTQNPGLDRIALFWQDADSKWQALQAGDQLAAKYWAEPARKPLFALPSYDAGTQAQVQTVYLRIAHQFVPITVPLSMMDGAELLASQRQSYLLLGAYCGMALIVLCWALVRAWTRKDRACLSYGVLTIAMLLMQASLTGIGTQWVWGSLPRFGELLAFMIVPIYGALAIHFSCVFTQLRRLSERMNFLAQATISAGALLALVQIFLHGEVTFMLSNLFAALAMMVSSCVFIYAHMRGTRYALWAWMGFVPVILGCLVPLARNVGLIGTSFWTQYAIAIGAAVEAVVLFVVLIRREAEVRDARVRLNALSSVDPLTGVSDERIFMTRLHESMMRCAQFNQRCGLIRAELRNFEWFLKEHGTERAERALVLAASAIRAVSRDVDTVGRLGRAELGLLLDGPVDAGDVTKAATQALARSLAPSDALPVGAHLQLHFAVCLLPDGAHAQQPMSAMEIWAWLSDSQRTTEQAPRNRVLAVNL